MKHTISLSVFASFFLGACGSVDQTSTLQLPTGSTVAQITDKTVIAFLDSCVTTLTGIATIQERLSANGFNQTSRNRGRAFDTINFESAFATARLSKTEPGGPIASCGMTPKGGNLSASINALNSNISKATSLPLQRVTGGSAAWALGETGAIALASGPRGSFTRTKAGVFGG